VLWEKLQCFWQFAGSAMGSNVGLELGPCWSFQALVLVCWAPSEMVRVSSAPSEMLVWLGFGGRWQWQNVL
jgi:hypothetical protein